MQGNSRSRRRPPKPSLEPISYEEMVGAAGMSGFVSFLEISPTDSNQQSAAHTSREFPSPAIRATEDQGPVTSSGPAVKNESAESANDVFETGIPQRGTPQKSVHYTYISSQDILEIDPGRLHDSGIPYMGVPESHTPENPIDTDEKGRLEKGIPDSKTPFHSLGAPDTSIADVSPPVQHILAAPIPISSKGGVPDSGIHLNFAPSYPSHRVRRATRVQDGHSLGEQVLYDALWQAARPYSDDARIITLGYRTMSELARLTANNCKANIRALIQKLAVAEAAPFSHSQGTTYMVYNFSAILQRRKAAGLTHYIRSRGVLFVDPESGTPITTSTHQRSGIPGPGIPSRASLPESGKSGVPHSDKGGVPQTEPQRKEDSSNRQPEAKTSTSFSVPERLITQLQQVASFFDEQAATLLWTECQTRVPDCTIDEVLYFARQKASVCRNGKIQNPVGFLLTAVPKCFEGDAFKHFRAEQVRLNEEEQKRKEAQQEKARLQAAELQREEELYHLAEQKLETLSTEEYQTFHDTVRRELTRSWKNFSLLTEQAQELNIRSRMLRELRERESQRT